MKQVKILQSDAFIVHEASTEEQRQDLLNQTMNAYHNANTPTFGFSNDGCWRARIEYNNIGWLEEKLKDTINKAVNYYLGEDPTLNDKLKLFKEPEIDSWTNVNDPGSINKLHTHEKWNFSAVYYIQGTDTGALNLLNPANTLLTCNPLSPFMNTFSFDPKDGDLIVWPSWLPHEVEINKSTRQRINIVYNVRFNSQD
jgi:uncharacterized protein (TIGR02466 family)